MNAGRDGSRTGQEYLAHNRVAICAKDLYQHVHSYSKLRPKMLASAEMDLPWRVETPAPKGASSETTDHRRSAVQCTYAAGMKIMGLPGLHHQPYAVDLQIAARSTFWRKSPNHLGRRFRRRLMHYFFVTAASAMIVSARILQANSLRSDFQTSIAKIVGNKI